jgi:hypothetical protein
LRSAAGLAAAAATVSVANADSVITAIGPFGQPVPNVAVICVSGGTESGLTDEQGHFALPEGCVEVECMRGGLLTARARVVEGAATCTLAEALSIRGEIRGTKGENWHRFRAMIVSTETQRIVQAASAISRSSAEPLLFSIDAPAGPYELRIVRYDKFWSCYADLGALSAGVEAVIADWREPTEVRGTVLDAEGRPFGGVLLRLVYESKGTGTLGQMRCELDDDALDVISERDGRFRALVDPTRRYRIVADDAWQPATVRLDEESGTNTPQAQLNSVAPR